MLRGIGLAALGYALFAMQDATVKWLVTGLPVPEILLGRSIVIVVIAFALGRVPAARALLHSRRKAALGVRAALILAAWLSFYNAAAVLDLAEITTLYFAAPIVAVVLAALILKERVVPMRWLAVLGGFGGVVLAAAPKPQGGVAPILLALFAAVCWGLSVVLVRMISRAESTPTQMLASNALFAAACLPLTLWSGRWPTPTELGLLTALGVFGGLGQWSLYEGFRFAPASAVAPVEYTGLIWAFLYGYLIWGEVPAARVFAGAALIMAASLALLFHEGRRARRAARPGAPRP